jgi:hypothetical protein
VKRDDVLRPPDVAIRRLRGGWAIFVILGACAVLAAGGDVRGVVTDLVANKLREKFGRKSGSAT